MIQPPQRTRPTDYRKPRKFNAVSVTLLAFLGIAVYIGYSLWPAMALRLRVKSELEEILPNFWRMNLRSEEQARPEIARMKRELLEKLPKVGVRDKHPEVVFDRGKKTVSIEARFNTTVTFPVLNKTRTFRLAPRVETDAARVEW